MSYKSSLSNSGSCRQNSVHEKLHSTPSEEKIKFAGDESKDRLYEPKQNKKMVRVFTVIIYIFSVSLAAIMLSLYYVFFWNPKGIHYMEAPAKKSVAMGVDNVTNRITTTIRLESHDGHGNKLEVTTETNTLPFQREDYFMDNNTTDDTSNLAFAPNSNDTETLPLTTTHQIIPSSNEGRPMLMIVNPFKRNKKPPST